MLSCMSPVGINVPRADGPAKVRGDAQYVDDIRPADCLYGATVRSPIAHGRIIGLEKDPDFDWTGITVVTAADIPAQNVVYLMTEDQPALADGVARHVEEPIALVAAPTRDPHSTRFATSPSRILLRCSTPWRTTRSRSSARTTSSSASASTRADRLRAAPSSKASHRGSPGAASSSLRADRCASRRRRITLIGSMQCPFYIEKALAPMLGHKQITWSRRPRAAAWRQGEYLRWRHTPRCSPSRRASRSRWSIGAMKTSGRPPSDTRHSSRSGLWSMTQASFSSGMPTS